MDNIPRKCRTLEALNAAALSDFTAALGEVFENAPWVAEQAALARPFATVTALHEAMLAAVHAAPPDRITAFLRGHPELAGAAAVAGKIGADSLAEQSALGLQRPKGDADALIELNRAYGDRFGFPFILCVRRHTRTSVMAEFRRRLEHDPESERDTALREIGYITRLRLANQVTGPGMPVVNGSLTTHVLDTAVGRPAQGVAMELLEVGGAHAVSLVCSVTNADGRTAAPLLHGEPLRIGTYELRFKVGGSLQGGTAQRPPFLDVIPIRFGISEPEAHYHIPLLVSPGAYSTYRGS
jgi:2-oxo-4-hydroxy-4-carboxy-5-ureidoimidazoline decarboxylase